MYRITQVLSVGPFASPERAEKLLAAGVTHVLNVSDAASVVAAGPGSFATVAWVPIEDHYRIPEADVVLAIDTLHHMISEPGAQVYVHCLAGQNRSPTILWLYLIACGLNPNDAREIIEERARDAVAGHPRLIGPDLVYKVQRHGLANYLPLPRGEVVVPFNAEQTPTA
jgi:hypothetical protein